jgi:hypothetical protein
MFSAIAIILILPITDLGRTKGLQFRPLSKIIFYVFVVNFLILMQLGAKHVESPFIEFGQISTVLYFAHFVLFLPLISVLENTLIDISGKETITARGFIFSSFFSNILKFLSVFKKEVRKQITWRRVLKGILTILLVRIFIYLCLPFAGEYIKEIGI